MTKQQQIRDEILRQLLLQFYLTGNEDILLLILHL
jgi:hypothetical protein